MKHATIAAIENDLAFISDALDAVSDLEAMMLWLCQVFLNPDAASRMSVNLVRIKVGLQTARKWESWLRNGKHLREE